MQMYIKWSKCNYHPYADILVPGYLDISNKLHCIEYYWIGQISRLGASATPLVYNHCGTSWVRLKFIHAIIECIGSQTLML